MCRSNRQVWKEAAETTLLCVFLGCRPCLCIHFMQKVLTQKWRPNNFQEVIGQDNIIKTLSNSFEQNFVHNAYLLSGPRGTGKTSIARIIAKCLSCVNAITSKPCNKCEKCLSINNGSFMDFIEIDAASRTKVEDTREILEQVQYTPTNNKFKIYLIDEVHMLSKHSFNALLKTIEEPPSHVKFIFATTEYKQVPNTIISRCIHFKLQLFPVESLVLQFENILSAEKIKFDKDSIQIIAKHAGGSSRDGLSLLQQAINYCDNVITKDKIQKMLKLSDINDVYVLIQNIVDNNYSKVLEILNIIENYGVDFNQTIDQILMALHSITLLHLNIKKAPSNHILDYIKDKINAQEVQMLYQIALNGKKDLAFSPTLKLGFEMTILRMLAFNPITVNNNEDLYCSTSVDIKSTQVENNHKLNHAIMENNDSTDENIKKQKMDWGTIVEKIAPKGLYKSILYNSKLESNNNENILYIEKSSSILMGDEIKDNVVNMIKKEIHNDNDIIISIFDSDEKDIITIQKSIDKAKAEKFKKNHENLTNDENASLLIDTFNAKIENIDNINRE